MYHLASKSFNASNSSAAAVLAYRVAISFKDPHDGRTKFPHRRSDEVEFHFTVNWDQPGASSTTPESYQQLLNEIGRTETRCNSRLLREFQVALPKEFNREQRIFLTRDFGLWLAAKYGVAVVIPLHIPPNAETENNHSHVLITTRRVERRVEGIQLTVKNRDLDSRSMLKQVRKRWEELLNHHYRANGICKQVSCESHATLGIGRIPSIHVGPGHRANLRDRHEINQAILKLNTRAPKSATSPEDVAKQIPAIKRRLVEGIIAANSEIAELGSALEEQMPLWKLTSRQEKQLAIMKDSVSAALNEVQSPLALAARLKSELGRGGVAGAPLNRLSKSLPPFGGNENVALAREGVESLLELLNFPNLENKERLRRWRDGLSTPKLRRVDFDNPVFLQQLLDWLRRYDPQKQPERAPPKN